MTLVIIQLSDIHIESQTDTVFARIDPIVRAVRGLGVTDPSYLLCFTGDIVNAGIATEFQAATEFSNEVVSKLKQQGSLCQTVYIPGNHDCYLPENERRMRELAVNDVIRAAGDDTAPDIGVIQNCIEVQDNFFQFMATQEGSPKVLAGQDRLAYARQFTCDRQSVLVSCINTSWLSQRHEIPARLLADKWMERSQRDPYGLSVALFHHPYNWLEPSNAKLLRRSIESVSDIIMTGHEHVSDQYAKTSLSGAANNYIEGGVLHEQGSPASVFNVVMVDFDRKDHNITVFSWDSDHYSATSSTGWLPLNRNPIGLASQIQNTSDFSEWLLDAGAAFNHPKKSVLYLEDIFVFPDLVDSSLESTTGRRVANVVVPGQALADYVEQYKKVLIVGSEGSGKTALLRTLYSKFLETDITPLYLHGQEIKQHEDRRLSNLIDNTIRAQYGVKSVERYRQMETNKKVLLIDDADRSVLNTTALNVCLEYFGSQFDTIVVMAGELLPLDEILSAAEDGDTLLTYRHCRIKSLGHLLRGRLIEKWIRAGSESLVDDREIAWQISQREKLVTDILGRNLLPSYPIFVLTILQTSETDDKQNPEIGMYGYHYEALITMALSTGLRTVPPRTFSLDTLYTSISLIADYMFTHKKVLLSEDNLKEVLNSYQASYSLDFNYELLVSILMASRILERLADNTYQFRYKYVYYYFVARHISDHLYEKAYQDGLRTQLAEMVKKLHISEYYNILIFVVYLTKDERLFDLLVEEASKLYSDEMPFDFDKHGDIVGSLAGKTRELTLPNGKAKQRQEEARRQRDHEDETNKVNDVADEQPIDDQNVVDEYLQVNKSFKALQILGQVLRNFPGTLHGERKRQLADESYSLGLRTLHFVMVRIAFYVDTFRIMYLAKVNSSTLSKETEQKIGEAADNFIYSLCNSLGTGFISTIASAVGSQYLTETYKKLESDKCPISYRLIRLKIGLDHDRTLPVPEIEELYNILSKTNPYSVEVLRSMVHTHLYLFDEPFSVRQKVCALLEIKSNDPRLLLSDGKQRLRTKKSNKSGRPSGRKR